MVALRYDPHSNVREQALNGLAPYLAEDMHVRDAVLEAVLDDGDPQIRSQAIRLLAPVCCRFQRPAGPPERRHPRRKSPAAQRLPHHAAADAASPIKLFGIPIPSTGARGFLTKSHAENLRGYRIAENALARISMR